MRKDTVALKGELGFLTRKFRAIWRTMLLRYPGKGKSIPAVCTVATSVPRPPVGPPPAFGAAVGFAALGLPSTGVARFVGAGAAFVGAGGPALNAQRASPIIATCATADAPSDPVSPPSPARVLNASRPPVRRQGRRRLIRSLASPPVPSPPSHRVHPGRHEDTRRLSHADPTGP